MAVFVKFSIVCSTVVLNCLFIISVLLSFLCIFCAQLGLGHAQQKVFVCTPIVPLRDKNVRTLAAGCYHSIIITANGK